MSPSKKPPSTTNTDTSSQAPKQSKKRKRQEKLQQYGIDLPNVPGVPVEVIPLLVNALKVATKCFQHETSAPYNEDWEEEKEEQTTQSTQNDGSALDSLLSRIDNNAQDSDQSKKQQQERRLKMQDAIQSWLQAVKRFVKRTSHHNNSTQQQPPIEDTSNNDPTKEPKNRKSVPLCCLEYLWQLGSEHKRVAVRRAALCMNRHLLDKSRDCRHYLLEDANHLWDWMQLLAASTGDDAKARLWQREGHLLLLHLLREGYDQLYPKLPVAEQYLRQACSLELSTQSTMENDAEEYGSTTNMNSLRELRDIALQYGPEEIQRVNKLLHKCHKCMDILVPRLGEEKKETSSVDDDNEHTDVAWEDADDNEDDEIDWEDGDDEPEQEDHALAVERTLWAMESMGGFKGGGLEINLSKPPVETLTANDDTPALQAARERFAKCARFLSNRHLPRIRAWSEGLTKADRLHSPKGTTSLILMSPQQGEERETLRKQLVDLRKQIISSIESAARLGLYNGSNTKV